MTPNRYRALVRVHPGEPVTDGDGVRISRVVAHGALRTYDPFLLLDEIVSDDAADYIGGFPEHPHRGFETVTYMLAGRMQHRDHMGNEGLLEAGGVQWMSAGRGVLHSEMPLPDHGRLHGFQLWINLPAAEKMAAPQYREYGTGCIPQIGLGQRSQARVIAGTLTTATTAVHGPVTGVSTRPDYFDIQLAADDTVALPVDTDKRVLLYVYHGRLQVQADGEARTLQQQQLGALGAGNALRLYSESGARLLLLAGRPLNEPIANRGPFVMNTHEEIEQAIADYRNGTLACPPTGDAS